MLIYVYEHVTAATPAGADHGLWAEAAAMRDALSTDLAELDGVEVITGFAERFDETVAMCDAVWLIAPETDGVLADLARRVERLGGRLLSPSSAFCAWAADKSRVAETLQGAGVPVPRGVVIGPNDPWPEHFAGAVVVKPNDGCGSQGIVVLQAGEERRMPDDARSAWRVEQHVPGVAASVALLGGPAGAVPLPACSQRLADDGTFTYYGGSCPLSPPLAARAERLARRAAAGLPAWSGYIGVDLVLGAADDGSQDCVIEVNPRLTTSYVGLRALAEINLAQATLDVAAGRDACLSFRDEAVDFAADGEVHYR